MGTWTASDEYNLGGSIGKGAFATVYLVYDKMDGTPYAAKEIEKRRFLKNGVLDQKVENEMKIMKKISHVGHCFIPEARVGTANVLIYRITSFGSRSTWSPMIINTFT